MYIIIGGGGKVGYHLALELLQSNNEVLIIEREGRFKFVSYANKL